MHFLRSSLVNRNKSKQLLIVLDGVGGIPNTVKTELDSAKTPNLNKFIKKSIIAYLLDKFTFGNIF